LRENPPDFALQPGQERPKAYDSNDLGATSAGRQV